MTWGEIDDRVNRLCHGLREQFGFAAGDRIAVLSQNSHEFVEIMFAASRLAAMYTGLNTRHHPNEMVQQMVDSGCASVDRRPIVRDGRRSRRGAGWGAGPDVGEVYERLLADSPATHSTRTATSTPPTRSPTRRERPASRRER